jgi:mono/diheme cytochrome c family protein
MSTWLRGRRGRLFVAALAAAGLVIGLVVWNAFYREGPAPYFESDEDHFLYGSVGTEAQNGVPYWIWLVLPRIFPEFLPGPGGYAALGLLSSDGHELPIGLSRVTIGVPRVSINCAFCHTTSVRTAPDAPRLLIAGGPSNQTSTQGYLRFLFACASDPRFTADVILAEIARNHRLSSLERLAYRVVIIPRTRKKLLEMKEQYAWADRNPDWGPGRVDPFNPMKFGNLGQPVDSTVGNSDTMPLWNVGGREGRAYHWDGLNTSLQEVVLSSALGDGTTPRWLDRDFGKWNATESREMSSLRRVQNYVAQRRPPKYPLAVDAALAGNGAAVYKAQCAECHDDGAERAGAVVPIDEIGTDPSRLAMWTANAATAYNGYGQGHAWTFKAFRKTNGYVAVPLDGLWLRAPYLHNGSVPTLADLLEPAEARPKRFWRGFDLLDRVRVGFVTTGADAERSGTLFDTNRPGNSNAGHTYGTTLPPESKRALIEYLKTR